MRKKILCFMLICLLLFGTSCTDIKQGLATEGGSQVADTDFENASPVSPMENNENTTTDIPANTLDVVPKVSVMPVTPVQIENMEYYEKIEAENFAEKTSCNVDGYSGDGYAKIENKFTIALSIPFTQHYDVSVCFYTESDTDCKLNTDGSLTGSFNKKNQWTKAKFSKVFLTAAGHELVLDCQDVYLIDYIEITNTDNNTEKQTIAPLSNPNATAATKELYQYLVDNYNTKIITGQYVSSPENKELYLIRSVVSQYPAIRFGDLKNELTDFDSKEIDAAVEWAVNGGIVGEIWHWRSPDSSKSIYANSTSFNPANAVTSFDISQKSLAELEMLYTNKEINSETLSIIKDIDLISSKLAILQENNVPVLWRPLHEAGGEWFWWGKDKDSYIWLWNLLYDRMTNYHNLNNLIWIWNGQSPDYIVPEEKYDIASIDIYLRNETDFGSHSAQHQWLENITGGNKMLAVSECGDIPNVNAMVRDNAIWSFYGLWYGSYLMDSNGAFSEAYNPYTDWYNMYNSEKAITLYNYINRN